MNVFIRNHKGLLVEITNENFQNLLAEHDKLENFLKTYNGTSSCKYEYERLRELKYMVGHSWNYKEI